MPKFQKIEICPAVFVDVDPENSIYKVHCRCASYNPNTSEFTGPFIEASINKCDRSYGIVTEDFLKKFEPDMMELQQWYIDETGREKKIAKLVKKGKIKKAKKLLK